MRQGRPPSRLRPRADTPRRPRWGQRCRGRARKAAAVLLPGARQLRAPSTRRRDVTRTARVRRRRRVSACATCRALLSHALARGSPRAAHRAPVPGPDRGLLLASRLFHVRTERTRWVPHAVLQLAAGRRLRPPWTCAPVQPPRAIVAARVACHAECARQHPHAHGARTPHPAQIRACFVRRRATLRAKAHPTRTPGIAPVVRPREPATPTGTRPDRPPRARRRALRRRSANPRTESPTEASNASPVPRETGARVAREVPTPAPTAHRCAPHSRAPPHGVTVVTGLAGDSSACALAMGLEGNMHRTVCRHRHDAVPLPALA